MPTAIGRLLRNEVITRKDLHSWRFNDRKETAWKSHVKTRHQWAARPKHLQRVRSKDVMSGKLDAAFERGGMGGVVAEIIGGKWFIDKRRIA